MEGGGGGGEFKIRLQYRTEVLLMTMINLPVKVTPTQASGSLVNV